ncbi:ZIP family metal transporter [Sandaracinus amylolyticus]|uniref:ZIP family metal transporter n=1 Tax=Sandaracinus amylolyticus TaxID=927083 RepID=UPI001F1C7DF4|nr:hypothetical protein [Sandaracinus amylolyticus]UJR85316.1 Hypothetical protein I5071_73960 [Sandaracinus amylolyticus]
MIEAFAWGLLASSGLVAGMVVGVVGRLAHRAVAAVMSVGAGVLLATATIDLTTHALDHVGVAATVASIVVGAAVFSLANAALAKARDRKRCGECVAQPTEADAPGSGTSIALGTALDAIPEAAVLGISLADGAPDLALVVGLALGNVPEALSSAVGMRHAGRSLRYVVALWSGIALGAALATAFASRALIDLGDAPIAVVEAGAAGALLAMAAETMIPEAFHGSPRFSGTLAAVGYVALLVLGAATLP